MVSLHSNRRVSRIPRDLGESFLLPVFLLPKAKSKESTIHAPQRLMHEKKYWETREPKKGDRMGSKGLRA